MRPHTSWASVCGLFGYEAASSLGSVGEERYETFLSALLVRSSCANCDPYNFVMNYSLTVQGNDYLAHNCLLPCYRWEYSVSLERTDILLIDPLANLSLLPYRFRIDVSYNDLQYTSITEVATTTFFGLLSQIGGQLSLFLGSSILNLVQSAIMIFILASRVLRQPFRRPVEPTELPQVLPRDKQEEFFLSVSRPEWSFAKEGLKYAILNVDITKFCAIEAFDARHKEMEHRVLLSEIHVVALKKLCGSVTDVKE
uniref:Cyclic nucleotide-binding domain-containing protein n=1 Tax=Steinernema glaseri TaxID=37863 RepID=A0A1I8AT65_9BILA